MAVGSDFGESSVRYETMLPSGSFSVAVRKDSRNRRVRAAAAVAASATAVLLLIGVLWQGSGHGQSEPISNALSKLKISMPDNYPARIWVYGGSEVSRHNSNGGTAGPDGVGGLLRKDHYRTKVSYIPTTESGDFRAALWNPNCKVIVFPSMGEYPMLSERTKVDMRQYVDGGGNLVFVGSYMLQMWMNDLFGFKLNGVYGPGPYFINPRAVKNTPYMYLSAKLEEIGTTPLVGVTTDSLPAGEGKCVYGNNGICVAFYIESKLGTITYLADPMLDTSVYHDPQAAGWVGLLHASVKM